ncbi:DUF6564 domain-containing protein [Aliarcobacter butzleri]|uniref:DUF6564 domain-containing protein n=1 Tax=Aliarcobacter butzleri TaxID=28197 RepID=UPI003AF4CF03
MSKVLIITLAGESTRFRKTLKKDVLKGIYKDNRNISILDILLNYSVNLFENIIIVGGYKFDELEKYVRNKNLDNIELVYNKLYKDGSNVSLIEGINAIKSNYNEVLFVEGDLVIDKNSFLNVVNSNKNIITYNQHKIEASKSVAYYITLSNQIKYIYDTQHNSFNITESFSTISNSGQIWKFKDIKLLKNIANSFNSNHKKFTNLATIEKYFNSIMSYEIDEICIKDWYNCNTINDYNLAIDFITGE